MANKFKKLKTIKLKIMKKPIITLTEKQFNKLLRVYKNTRLAHEMHYMDEGQTKEEVKEVEEATQVYEMLCRKKESYDKKLELIEEKRQKKINKKIEREEKEIEKLEKERYKKTMLERKEMFSYESIETFLRTKYPDLKKAIGLEEWEDDEYKIKNIYPRVAKSFQNVLDFEKQKEKEGRMKIYLYRSIEDLFKAARSSITRQMMIDKGLAYEDENGRLVHIR